MKTLNPDILSARIHEHAEDDLKNGRIGGAELIVNQDGKRVFHETFGKRSANGEATPRGLLYRAASMTKPITTAAVLHLVDSGRLDLNESVARYFPALEHAMVARNENGRMIYDHKAVGTIRVYHLLSHTSGIGTHPLADIEGRNQPVDSLAHVADYYTNQPLQFDPYTGQGYSSTAAFDVAARILEMISDMSFTEYLNTYLFRPLGMTDTTFLPTEAQWARMITMHNRTEEGVSVDASTVPDSVFENLYPSCTAAGAGLATTAEDYSRFAEMLCAEGLAADGTRVLSAEAVRNMRTPHVPEHIMNGDQRWGLGVRVITLNTYPFGLKYGCFGWSGAYGTHFWVDPENKVTAIYMKNSRYDGGAGCRTGCVFEEDVAAALGNL